MRADARSFLVHERSIDRGRRNDDGVGIRFRQRQMELLYKLLLNIQGMQIVDRGNFVARFKPRRHVFAVIRGTRRKKSLLGVEKVRLNPGDMIARVFGFIQQGNRDVGCFHARLAESAKGGIKSFPHFSGKGVEKKLARDTETNLAWVNPQSSEFREVRLPSDSKIDRAS